MWYSWHAIIFQLLNQIGFNTGTLLSDKGTVRFRWPRPLVVYRAHVVMTIKNAAVNTLCKGAKKCSRLECTVQICATAHARDGSAPSSGAIFHRAFRPHVELQPQAFVTLSAQKRASLRTTGTSNITKQ
jgi:hypothetical protein